MKKEKFSKVYNFTKIAVYRVRQQKLSFLLSPVGIQKNIKFEKRGLSLLLHICLHQIHNNDIVICRLNIEYGFCFTSAFLKNFSSLLEVSSSEATKSYSNYFKRLQKRKCVLLYLEIFFSGEQFSVRKKIPAAPENLLSLENVRPHT